ncbi:hypothetical protein F183_A15560 [Bryobacterales bacterium F-183]|nr:hypothetical protein F183_A15560 [Bryobacterales bacterium F-183]
MQSPRSNYTLASIIAALLTFSRVMLGLCLILLTLVFLATATGLVNGESKGIMVKMPVTVQLTGPVAQTASSNPARLVDLHGSVLFPARTGTFLSVHLLTGILAICFLLWGVTQLRALFHSIRQGNVFIPDNVTRIRRIGWMVIVGEFIRAALGIWWSYYSSTNFKADGVQFITEIDVNGTPILCGLVILVVAQVFREGVRLIDEQSLTI